MFDLDLRTVILLTGVLSVLLALVMGMVYAIVPRTVQGVGYWVVAPLLVAASTALFGARGHAPALLTVVLANLLLLGGMLALLLGSRRFFGLPLRHGRWLAVLAVTAVLLYGYSAVEDDFHARLRVVGVVWIAILLTHAQTVWRHGPEDHATRYTVGVLLAHAAVVLLRLLTSFLPLPQEGLFTPSRVQTLYILVNALVTIALTAGLMMLVAQRLRRELEYLATRDALTGARTRPVLLQACRQELARCRRHGRSMALLVMDVDHFKRVNDQHGHQMGDRVLIDVVARVSSLLRLSDLLARFGGEEFVLLLPETTLQEALAVAERIRRKVALPQDGLPEVTVSIGVTTNRADEDDVDALLACADRALYRAKEQGRNRIETA